MMEYFVLLFFYKFKHELFEPEIVLFVLVLQTFYFLIISTYLFFLSNKNCSKTSMAIKPQMV